MKVDAKKRRALCWRYAKRREILKNSFNMLTIIMMLVFPILGYSESNDEIALRLIEKYRIGENLSYLSFQTALQTTTVQALAGSLGPEKTVELIKVEISNTVPKYQDQWNKNLAMIYSKSFSKKELESLVSEGPKSKYSEKMWSKSKQDEIGEEMQKKSSDIVQKVLQESIVNAYLEANKK